MCLLESGSTQLIPRQQDGPNSSCFFDPRLAKEEMARRKAEERAKREEEVRREAEEMRKMREEEERRQEEERCQRESEQAARLQKQVRPVAFFSFPKLSHQHSSTHLLMSVEQKEEEESRQREQAERLRQERERHFQKQEAERMERKKVSHSYTNVCKVPYTGPPERCFSLLSAWRRS